MQIMYLQYDRITKRFVSDPLNSLCQINQCRIIFLLILSGTSLSECWPLPSCWFISPQCCVKVEYPITCCIYFLSFRPAFSPTKNKSKAMAQLPSECLTCLYSEESERKGARASVSYCRLFNAGCPFPLKQCSPL